MTKLLTVTSPKNVSAEFAALPVIAFVAEHQCALWHAARLLGGYNASRLVDQCVEQLEKERAITQRILLMLDQLLALLTSQHSDDPDAEICLLSDRLRSVLAEAQKRRDLLPAVQ
jgi:hypothetical protein